MRKLIVTEFVSLDGVMEAPGGEGGYAHPGRVAAPARRTLDSADAPVRCSALRPSPDERRTS